MGHRAGIFSELVGAEYVDILDALDAAGTHIGRKFLITKNCKTFLEAELKPVTTGHTIAGPVMEIFVTNDAFYILVIGIGRCIGTGQYVFGIEDIEPLVLHGTHVEVINGHDIKDIQIIFPAIGLLIPAHGIDD